MVSGTLGLPPAANTSRVLGEHISSLRYERSYHILDFPPTGVISNSCLLLALFARFFCLRATFSSFSLPRSGLSRGLFLSADRYPCGPLRRFAEFLRPFLLGLLFSLESLPVAPVIHQMLGLSAKASEFSNPSGKGEAPLGIGLWAEIRIVPRGDNKYELTLLLHQVLGPHSSSGFKSFTDRSMLATSCWETHCSLLSH